MQKDNTYMGMICNDKLNQRKENEMEIHIGIKDGVPFCEIPRKEVDLTEFEEQFVEALFLELSKHIDVTVLRLDKRSNAYTTIICSEDYLSDFLRFKLTDRTKWFSVAVSQEDILIHKESELFKDQKNKNERYWKVKMNSHTDFIPYLQIIKNSIVQQLTYQN